MDLKVYLDAAQGVGSTQDGSTAFLQFLERCGDAIWLLDPHTGVFIHCNQAAVELMRCGTREKLLNARPEDLSPPVQSDGRTSRDCAAAYIREVEEHGSARFEWVARRFDGALVPLEVLSTALVLGGHSLQVVISRDVSERKAAEAAVREGEERFRERAETLLKESEARARTLVEHAPDAIVVLDCDTGFFVDANQNAVRLYGLPLEQLLQCGPEAVSPALQPGGRPSAELAREKLQEALDGGTPVFDWWHRTADGKVIPCEIRLVRLPAQGRRLIRGSIIDNTERERHNRIQKALYQISEAVHTADDLQALFREIHATIQGLMVANNFYIALFDPATELFSFPYFVDEMDPPPEPRRLSTGLTSHVLKTGKPLLVNRQSRIRKDRSGVAVLEDATQEAQYVEAGTPAAVWLGAPLNIHGRTIGVLAVQDYHEEQVYGEEEKGILAFVAGQIAAAIDRKRSEQALRESEAKFRALFEASSQGVMLHDEEKFLEVNSATVRILGYDRPEEILGKHPAETSAPVQANGEPAALLSRKHIQKCMREGRARFEWIAQSARGAEVPIEVILTRIPMGGRQIIQAVINDITERKSAEAELVRALARKKELGQLRSNFVSMVSHEFRTPLGIILSSAEILRDYLEKLDPADRQQHLDSISKNTRRMADLMEEVLLLGQFEAGKMDFQAAALDLASFARRLVDEMLSATERRCPIECHVSPGLGQATADERLLRHIFTNLLSNAVKYSEPGQPVRWALRAEGELLVSDVQDAGIGIPQSDLEWLFNAFHRGRNVGKRPGTGLGLVIVKRCVELHGGRIHVTSLPGKGTTMTVRLPVFSTKPS